MTVNELVELATDYFQGVTVDETIRAIRNTIRDVNGAFRGLHKLLTILEDSRFYHEYWHPKTQLPGTIQITPGAVPETDPSNLQGDNADFTIWLESGDVIYVNGALYTISDVIDDDSATITAPNITEPVLSLAYRIIDDQSIELNGLEKTLLRVYVNGELSREVKSFDQCTGEENAYIRAGYDRIVFNYLPENPRIALEGLYGISNIETRTDEIEMPQAWEAILTNGILFYLSKIPKFRDEQATADYSRHYYQKLRDLSASTDLSIAVNPPKWDYAKARKE